MEHISFILAYPFALLGYELSMFLKVGLKKGRNQREKQMKSAIIAYFEKDKTKEFLLAFIKKKLAQRLAWCFVI